MRDITNKYSALVEVYSKFSAVLLEPPSVFECHTDDVGQIFISHPALEASSLIQTSTVLECSFANLLRTLVQESVIKYAADQGGEDSTGSQRLLRGKCWAIRSFHTIHNISTILEQMSWKCHSQITTLGSL